MKESKFIRYMITGVVCAFFLMCELTLIKYCKTSMFFMRGEVIKLSLIAGIILIPFEKIGYSLYCKRILRFKKDFGIFGRNIALAMSVLIGSLIIIGKEVNDPDIYCILIPILTICWIIAMAVCDVSDEENPIYLFVVAAIQYFAVEYLGIGVFAIFLMLMQTISVFKRQNKNAKSSRYNNIKPNKCKIFGGDRSRGNSADYSKRKYLYNRWKIYRICS